MLKPLNSSIPSLTAGCAASYKLRYLIIGHSDSGWIKNINEVVLSTRVLETL